MTYRLDEIIGQGAIGLVYRGALVLPDPLPPMVIAIKHLHLPSTNPHLNRRNFEQLIAAMSLVDHPNILSYYGSHMIDEDCFLFMEYCDGGTLGDWIRKHGPLRDVRILSFWIRQLVQGLEFLGRHGIVHRDIKPSNIMIKDGILKIADFGSAQIHGLCCRKVCRQYSSVHDARVVGTPCYIAPEIVAGNQEFQIRGAQDMWSLGCVIYELVLGKPPFSEVDNVWSLYFVLVRFYSVFHLQKVY
ncbi:kinase-like domain-containing protein [Blastocladiella britannica]|nr:kinase-like domain-containing protein [Blastocladiella britannica]